MGLWSWLKGLFRAPADESVADDKPLIAIVLLLKRPRLLEAEQVAALASDALGEPITSDESAADDGFVSGSAPSFVLKYRDDLFLINSFPKPYMDDPASAADSIPELRLARAVRDHRAWLSVDLLGDLDSQRRGEVLRTIGRLTAAFADGDCLAVYTPTTRQLSVCDRGLRERLRGDDPLALFDAPGMPPVIPVSGDDPRLKAAVARARRRWPEFVGAFEERQPEQKFAVKARLGDGEHFEFMWLSVTGMENGYVYGRLDNEPLEVTGLRLGDKVRVPDRELSDWIYTDGDRTVGGFTIEVLRRIQEEL
jgi:uncharacterized protein YegJ (DUF2314 family)